MWVPRLLTDKSKAASQRRLKKSGLFSSDGKKSNYPYLEKMIEGNASKKGKISIKEIRNLKWSYDKKL